jgi:hypothetical protein
VLPERSGVETKVSFGSRRLRYAGREEYSEKMVRPRKIVVLGTVAVVAAGFAAAAYAQAQPQTPKNWNYTLDKNGQRVPKGSRVTNPDGSWREEVRQGNCVTVKEKSATGEYKETRQCNPQNPG